MARGEKVKQKPLPRLSIVIAGIATKETVTSVTPTYPNPLHKPTAKMTVESRPEIAGRVLQPTRRKRRKKCGGEHLRLQFLFRLGGRERTGVYGEKSDARAVTQRSESRLAHRRCLLSIIKIFGTRFVTIISGLGRVS